MEEFEAELHEVVGNYLLQPVITLLEHLEDDPKKRQEFIAPKKLTRGFAASIIPLATTVIESFTYMAQIHLGFPKPLTVPEFLKQNHPTSDFKEKMIEVFAVRNAITHSHLWKNQVSWDIFPMTFKYTPLEPEVGHADRKDFLAAIDPSTNLTKTLGLNIVPTRLTKSDAITIVKIAAEYLLFLDNDVAQKTGSSVEETLDIAGQIVLYRGQAKPFVEIIATLVA